MQEQQILDHGYLKFIEAWGSDERIIESARMSTDGAFRGWGPLHSKECEHAGTPKRENWGCCPDAPGDEKLLRYLYKNKHTTPFEMGGLTIEVQAPIFVFRQWHRHRTQCLAGDTMLHFDLPPPDQPLLTSGERSERVTLARPVRRQMPIAEAWRKWQPARFEGLVPATAGEWQENALWNRLRLAGMWLRCANEETREITYTQIIDVIRGEPKQLYRVTTVSGRTIRATLDHQFFTTKGWQRLEDAVASGAQLAVDSSTENSAEMTVSVGFEEVIRFEKDSVEVTYDLAVAAPWHNFVANGLVVHNSYNELSARYTELPDLFYVPSVERIIASAQANTNKQASGKGSEITEAAALHRQQRMRKKYEADREFYLEDIAAGMAPELARISIPVAQYSRMRASGNLWNWLRFQTLRLDAHAQYEIRLYAEAVDLLIQERFPRTWQLFQEGMFRDQLIQAAAWEDGFNAGYTGTPNKNPYFEGLPDSLLPLPASQLPP